MARLASAAYNYTLDLYEEQQIEGREQDLEEIENSSHSQNSGGELYFFQKVLMPYNVTSIMLVPIPIITNWPPRNCAAVLVF